MTTVLRRGRLLDISIVGFILCVFTLVPVVLLFKNAQEMMDKNMRIAKIVLLAISWPFLIGGASTLISFWHKGRTIDKTYLSSATLKQLRFIMTATLCILIGALIVIVAEVLSLTDAIHLRPDWRIIVDVAIIVLLLLVSRSIAVFIVEVFRARQSMLELLDDNGDSNLDDPNLEELERETSVISQNDNSSAV